MAILDSFEMCYFYLFFMESRCVFSVDGAR